VMKIWLEHGDVAVEDPDPADIAALIRTGVPFWLDIEDPTEVVIDQMAEHLGLHALAVEDSKQFAQRGKLQVYGDVAMMVGFGLDAERGEPVEVHCYLATGFIVTFHQAPSDALAALHRTGSLRAQLGAAPMRLLHHTITSLHDRFPLFIDGLEERLSKIERDMVDEPLDRHLVEIAAIRRTTEVLRRTLTPGREVAGRATVVMTLPGASDDDMLYATDVLDELGFIVTDLAAVGERCLALLGLHASLVSTRQGAASRQLAAVATIFLPITFVVGFFGMNFDVLINHFEQGWPIFVILGVLLNVVCIVSTLWLLRRRGWG
jgi:magnesium transporter